MVCFDEAILLASTLVGGNVGVAKATAHVRIYFLSHKRHGYGMGARANTIKLW